MYAQWTKKFLSMGEWCRSTCLRFGLAPSTVECRVAACTHVAPTRRPPLGFHETFRMQDYRGTPQGNTRAFLIFVDPSTKTGSSSNSTEMTLEIPRLVTNQMYIFKKLSTECRNPQKTCLLSSLGYLQLLKLSFFSFSTLVEKRIGSLPERGTWTKAATEM